MLLKKSNTSFRIGLCIAACMAAMALIGYVWTPYDPEMIVAVRSFSPFSAPPVRYGQFWS